MATVNVKGLTQDVGYGYAIFVNVFRCFVV